MLNKAKNERIKEDYPDAKVVGQCDLADEKKGSCA